MAFVIRTAILASALALAFSSAWLHPITAQAPPADETASGGNMGDGVSISIAHSSRISVIT